MNINKADICRLTNLFGKKNLSLVILSVLCLTLFSPVLSVFSSVFQPHWAIWSHLYHTVLTDYIINSLLLMLGVGAFSLVWGVLPAWFITMYSFPMARFFEWALLLPLAVPAYIIAYTYTDMLDVGGIIQQGLQSTSGLYYQEYWFPEIRSLYGAIILISFVLYPYIYLLVRTSFIEQSICALDMARTLGYRQLDIFIKVAIPLARPAIIVGLSIVLIETLADYGTVQYFGVPVFTTGIFHVWFGLGEELAAAQLAALMMIFVLILIVIERRSRRQQRYHHTGTHHYYYKHVKINLYGFKGYCVALFCALPLFIGFIIPICYLFYLMIQSHGFLLDKESLRLFQHSFTLALSASLLALLFALLIAYIHRIYRSVFTFSAMRLISMGYAIPGMVIAVGVLTPLTWLDKRIDFFFYHYFEVNTGLLLSGTLFILVFAYLTRYLAVSLNTVEAALEKIKPAIDEVARTTGVSTSYTLKKIHMPMMRGSLLTAALLVFVDVLKELPATLILRPFNFNTLAVRTYELANEERLAEAAAPALAIVLAGIVPVILISKTIARTRHCYEK